jgi:hypothetical protein
MSKRKPAPPPGPWALRRYYGSPYATVAYCLHRAEHDGTRWYNAACHGARSNSADATLFRSKTLAQAAALTRAVMPRGMDHGGQEGRAVA